MILAGMTGMRLNLSHTTLQASESYINAYQEAAKELGKSIVSDPKKEPKPAEEWVWINGYKGTDKDMKCRDYQYELQKCFDISDDKEVKECEHGFHLCKYLTDVFRYYDIDNSNRFFEVKALVRKSDLDSYSSNGGYYTRGIDGMIYWDNGKNKLVAKSIIFTRELTVDEIVKHLNVSDWDYEDKLNILEVGYKTAKTIRETCKLVSVGYSETFAKVIAETNKFDIAYAVGTQAGLSMDMKVWIIYNHS